MKTDKDQELLVVQSDLSETTVYKGILSLRLSLSDADGDPHEQLKVHETALQVGLRAYFGFKEARVLKILKTPSFDGRQLRSGPSTMRVHFSGRGGNGRLADDSGLQAELQTAFDSANSGIMVEESSVEWLNPTLKDCSISTTTITTTVIVATIIGFVCLGSLTALCYIRYRRQKSLVQHSLEQIQDTFGTPDLEKIGKQDSIDNASESTADVDAASECAVSSTPSIASWEELGQKCGEASPGQPCAVVP